LSYHIDGHPVSETYFWRSLEGLAGPTQLERLRTWGKLIVGGVLYEMTVIKEVEYPQKTEN